MRVTIHFEYGPITAEIEAEEGEDYKAVINDLKESVRIINSDTEEDVKFANGSRSEEDEQTIFDSSGKFGNPKEDEKDTQGNIPMDGGGPTENITANNPMMVPILSDERNNLSEKQLAKLLSPGKEDTHPKILASNFLPEGTKRREMLNGSIILLMMWKKCHNITKVNSSMLMDALGSSGLIDERLKRIYEIEDWDTYLEKEGQRRGTKLSLKPLGEDYAFELIAQMAQEAGV